VTLYVEESGEGPPVVLLHGWGLHGGIFAPLVAELAAHFHLIVPDLPGFGRSARSPARGTLADLQDAVAAIAPRDAVWIGWSLGALVALEAARAGLTGRLVLTGATPCFVQRDGWAHGMPRAVLEALGRDLETDFRATLLRFLSLNAGDGPEARIVLRELRARIFDHGEPDAASLRAGLAILGDTDLRGALGEVAAPALVIHGERDRLAHPLAARALASALPDATLMMLPDAGHAPFLSHPREFAKAVAEFAE
jgi:pimeloyl-[acyl-carrier protein] methyl ester esterase